MAAYALPAALLAAMVLLYWLAPEFYLTYILEAKHRETQAVEIFTFLAGFSAALLLFWSAGQFWREQWHEGKIPGLPGGPILIATTALATLFFAGEEISWGQSYLRWETHELFLENDNRETNLHNLKTLIRVQSLGSLYLVAMFFGLPLAWRLRRLLQLPADWGSAVAPGYVVFTFVCAFAWANAKDLYLAATTAQQRAQSVVYVEFIEQTKEHKEMLIAVALLLYGLHLLHLVRRNRRQAAAELGNVR